MSKQLRTLTNEVPADVINRQVIAELRRQDLIVLYRNPKFPNFLCMTGTKKVDFLPKLDPLHRWLGGMLLEDQKDDGKVWGLPRPLADEWWQAGYDSPQAVYFQYFQEDVHGREVYVRRVMVDSQPQWIVWSPPNFNSQEITLVQHVVDFDHLNPYLTHRFVVTDPQQHPAYNNVHRLVCYTGGLSASGQLFVDQAVARHGFNNQLRTIPIQSGKQSATDLITEIKPVAGFLGWIQDGQVLMAYNTKYIAQLTAESQSAHNNVKKASYQGAEAWELWDHVPRPVVLRHLASVSEQKMNSDPVLEEAPVSGA